MDKTIEDLLKALCSEVSLLSSNETQVVYKLSPIRDAHTAYDVLNSFGIESKIYDESDHCRLYITLSSLAGAEDRLGIACLYAHTLGEISDSLDNLCCSESSQLSDFSMNLMTVPGNGKRITISLEVLKNSAQPKDSATSTPPPNAHQARRIPQKQRRRTAFGKQEVTVENIGLPKMAKTYLMEEGPNKGKEKGAHWRWLYTHFGRHILENSGPAIVLVFFLFLVTSVYVTAKGFVCPDLAVNQDKLPWYCDKEKLKSKLRGDDIYIPGGR